MEGLMHLIDVLFFTAVGAAVITIPFFLHSVAKALKKPEKKG